MLPFSFIFFLEVVFLMRNWVHMLPCTHTWSSSKQKREKKSRVVRAKQGGWWGTRCISIVKLVQTILLLKIAYMYVCLYTNVLFSAFAFSSPCIFFSFYSKTFSSSFFTQRSRPRFALTSSMCINYSDIMRYWFFETSKGHQ